MHEVGEQAKKLQKERVIYQFTSYRHTLSDDENVANRLSTDLLMRRRDAAIGYDVPKLPIQGKGMREANGRET